MRVWPITFTVRSSRYHGAVITRGPAKPRFETPRRSYPAGGVLLHPPQGWDKGVLRQ